MSIIWNCYSEKIFMSKTQAKPFVSIFTSYETVKLKVWSVFLCFSFLTREGKRFLSCLYCLCHLGCFKLQVIKVTQLSYLFIRKYVYVNIHIYVSISSTHIAKGLGSNNIPVTMNIPSPQTLVST